jgi:hypothetical protein
VLASPLALLGFLLAISFGLTADRFGERKALVLEEANAIGELAQRVAEIFPLCSPESRAWRSVSMPFGERSFALGSSSASRVR